MAFLSELGEVIHEEHFRMLVMVCELENRVKGAGTVKPIDATDPEDRALLLKVIAGLDELIGHNAFEESVLFPAIAESGDGALTRLIAEEHFVVEPLAQRLRSLAVDTLRRGPSFARWTALQEATVEFAANLILHLETEEVTIVQRLRLLLDPRLDHELALRYLRERCRAPTGRAQPLLRHGMRV
jgi:iron-sulfur cluster repair protein YtfE (RIC family)